MISKEQIAHDLAMIYMNNRYGVSVSGDFFLNDGSGNGSVATEHFPNISEPQYTKVSTGKKGLFGIEKKEKIQSGCKVDALFIEMTETYFQAYGKFYQLLCDKEETD